MTIGEKIKESRIRADVTQQELADKLGIKVTGISQWETDRRTPKFGTMRKIADALGIPVTELLELPPESNKKVNEMINAISVYDKKLQSAIQNGSEEAESLKSMIEGAEKALDDFILPAKVKHHMELARKRTETVQERKQNPPQMSDYRQDLLAFLQGEAETKEQGTSDERDKMQDAVYRRIHEMMRSADDEKRLEELLSAYEGLNDAGRVELTKRAQEMMYVPDYAVKKRKMPGRRMQSDMRSYQS